MQTYRISLAGRLDDTPRFIPGATSAQSRAYVTVVTAQGNTAVVAFGAQAEYLCLNGRKGGYVYVSGSLSVNGTGNSIVVADNISFTKRPSMRDTQPMKALTPQWTMMAAYEANKKSKKCVACGTELAMHPSVGVLYCKCVEDLPRK